MPARRSAQDPFSRIYGHAVHEYFDGDYFAADELLTRVIDSGSKDPRAYYFRGLARLRTGVGDASADFAAGARSSRPRGPLLRRRSRTARVQGADRRTLEEQRAEARFLAAEQLRIERQRRYQDLREEEQAVLLRPVPNAPGDADPFDNGGAVPRLPPNRQRPRSSKKT
ncbi:MAG: hypothetical protein R3C10_03350 [Pirellulales bacterium]